MRWKDRYDILVEEIASKPSGLFDIYDFGEKPLIYDKLEFIDGDMTFNGRLPEDSSEEDYHEYCKMICDYVGYDLSYFFADVIEEAEKKPSKRPQDLIESSDEE